MYQIQGTPYEVLKVFISNTHFYQKRDNSYLTAAIFREYFKH